MYFCYPPPCGLQDAICLGEKWVDFWHLELSATMLKSFCNLSSRWNPLIYRITPPFSWGAGWDPAILGGKIPSNSHDVRQMCVFCWLRMMRCVFWDQKKNYQKYPKIKFRDRMTTTQAS